MKHFKFLVHFSRLLYSVSIAVLCLYTALAFINVIARYIFLKPYAWTEEITTLLFVVGVYFNQVSLEVFDKQLSVSFLTAKIKNRTLSKLLYILQRLSVVILFLVLAREAIPVISRNYAFATSTVVLKIPMWPLYTIVGIVMLTVALTNVVKVLALFLPGESADT